MRSLGQFVLRFALPALLFTMLARRSVAEIFDARYLLAYLGGSLITLAAGWFYARRHPASYRQLRRRGLRVSRRGDVRTARRLPGTR